MKYLIFTITCVLISSDLVCASKCKKSEDAKVDTCAQRLFLFGDRTSGGFPETEEGLANYCSLARETEKCIKDYSRRCLAAFPRQVTNLLVFGIANQQKKYCKKGASAIVQHGKCGNSDLEKGHKCMDVYIDHLYGIQESEDANKKIPYVCCSFYKFKRCVVSNLRRQKSTCNRESVNFYAGLIHGIAADVLELICAEYKENSTQCSETLKTLPTRKPGTTKSKSILPPFTAIMESL